MNGGAQRQKLRWKFSGERELKSAELCACIAWMRILWHYISTFGSSQVCVASFTQRIENSKCQKINQSKQKLLLDVLVAFSHIDFAMQCNVLVENRSQHQFTKRYLTTINEHFAWFKSMCECEEFNMPSQRSINETHLTYSNVRNFNAKHSSTIQTLEDSFAFGFWFLLLENQWTARICKPWKIHSTNRRPLWPLGTNHFTFQLFPLFVVMNVC